ncbi:MAG: hypothetical protein FD180_3779 [Planctomycetota bacterium]|nr:MAG: hypothetical protein FD180_3779 [Planctomycetota bacterium]
MDDDRLYDALTSCEGALPLEAAQECLRRLDRLAPRFVALCKDPESWHRLDCGHWAVLHAWLILGASGREEFGSALFWGACYLIPLDFYRRVWFVGDSTMAGFAVSFLDILAEAASDHRRGVAFENCATVILGVALVRRPERRRERAEALLRVFRNPATASHTRSLALGFIVESGESWATESLLRDSELERETLNEIRYRIDRHRENPIDRSDPVPALRFYSEEEQARRNTSIQRHRESMAGEIAPTLNRPLDAAAHATLRRFEQTLSDLPAEAASGAVLAARWLLASEATFGDPLLSYSHGRLEWLMHRLVYRRNEVEKSRDFDFWDAIERFHKFLATDRPPAPPTFPWQPLIAALRCRYGSRAGF